MVLVFSLPSLAGFACFAPICQVLQKQLEMKTQEQQGSVACDMRVKVKHDLRISFQDR